MYKMQFRFTGKFVSITKCRTFNMGNNITCSTNCEYRAAATLYTLEARFVSGLKLQISCIKGKTNTVKPA